jgi:hypothetical protein
VPRTSNATYHRWPVTDYYFSVTTNPQQPSHVQRSSTVN